VSKLSPESQQSLLRPLEKYAQGNVVIFTTNDDSKTLPALKSRCREGTLTFAPVPPEFLVRRLSEVSNAEGWKWPSVQVREAAIAKAAKESAGDVRAAIGILANEYRDVQAGG